MPMATINGLQTHIQQMPAVGADPDAGPPPAVVFLHGLGTDSLASFYLTLGHPVSEAGMDVLTYDMRGHGRTERPAEGYTLQHFTDDLIGVLAEVGIDRPVHLVGNSFGGTVAFAFAAAHPERTASVVSIESEPPTADWASRMGDLMSYSVELLSEEETYEAISEAQGVHTARLSRLAYQRLTSTSMVTDVPLGPLVTAEELAEMTIPVMNVIGADGMQADDPYAMERMVGSCRTEILEGQDHSVLVHAHHQIRDLLLSWIDEQETAAKGALEA